MQDKHEQSLPATTFKNPQTRERWEWVQQAISFAEHDSQRELECRADDPVRSAPSPFME
ncbi:MAG: hypothetical protein AAF270_07320 [Pseudomonadota bacterium]